MASREQRRLKEKKSVSKEEMNQVERRREKNPLLYIGSVILFVIITVAFIGSGFFGAGSFQGQPTFTFGEYDGKKIEWSYGNYFEYQQRVIADREAQRNPNADINAQTRQIWQEAFNTTVKHTAILQKAADSGYFITEKGIDKAVLQYPYYQDENGNFSEKLYYDKNKRERDQVRTLYKEFLMEQLYTDDVLNSRYYSTKEVDFYKQMMMAERAVRFVEFSFSEYPEEAVKAYGSSNISDFRKIELSRILLTNSNKATADSILEQYSNGTRSFDNLAKEWSRDVYAEKGGNMGTQFFYQIKNFFENREEGEKIANEIFSLKEGNAGVYPDGENWVIFQVNSTAVEPDLNSDETIQSIRDYILTNKRGEVEDYAAKKAKEFADSAAAIGFDAAAKAIAKFPVSETEYFPINYRDIFYGSTVKVKGDDTTKLASASGNEEFFTAVFSLKDDSVSAPIILDDKVVVLQLIGEQTKPEEDWDQLNSTYKSFIAYQAPQLANMAKGRDDAFFYYFTARSYLDDDHNNSVIDDKKLKDNFEASFKKFFNLQ